MAEIIAYVDVGDVLHAEIVSCCIRVAVLQILRQRAALGDHSSPLSLLEASIVAQILPRCPSLMVLNLNGSSQTNDGVLRALACGAPPLRCLYLSGCNRVTDDGVDAAVAALGRSLELLDLTFARGTTYGAAISAYQAAAGASRNCGAKALCVRRLPLGWPGRFGTPWGEVHTYWPDGSFDFGRLEESSGWVVDLAPCVDGVGFTDRLQFVDQPIQWPTGSDIDAQNSADELMRGRPGILVHTVGPLAAQEFVVVQSQNGPAPPEKFTRFISGIAELMYPGTMVHFDDPHVGPVVISSMLRTPLLESEVAPPADILNRLMTFANKHPMALLSPRP